MNSSQTTLRHKGMKDHWCGGGLCPEGLFHHQGEPSQKSCNSSKLFYSRCTLQTVRLTWKHCSPSLTSCPSTSTVHAFKRRLKKYLIQHETAVLKLKDFNHSQIISLVYSCVAAVQWWRVAFWSIHEAYAVRRVVHLIGCDFQNITSARIVILLKIINRTAPPCLFMTLYLIGCFCEC